MSITAAYRFVPLNRQVFIPDFPLPNHDIPYEEGENGEIEISFQNMTPLFVKNGEGKKDKDDKDGYYYSEHIIENGEKRYFIPATSWKGMIRSIVEIMSYSRLQDDQYDHRTFAYREMHNASYLSEMEDLKCGWLYVHNNQYYILPSGEIKTIEMDCIPIIGGVSYASIKTKDILGKLERYGNRYPEINGKILVFTGHIGGERTGKSHEYLFVKPENIEEDRKKPIDDTVVKDFFEAYKDSPYNDAKKGRHIETWLETGKKLPVFYKEEEGGGVVRIGFTRMHRVLHQYGIADGVRKQDNPSGLDMAQRIFGYIDDKKSSLRGRVQFSHAWTNNNISDERLKRVVGILGQPKASYYPLYLQNGTHYDDKDLVIAGRKRYVIQQNAIGFPKDLPNNENVQSRLALLPAGNIFTLKIRFHNLLPEELGAILSALTFHNTNDLYHNIGMAKAYGYGKLQWQKVTLRYTKEKASYYMKRFETMMNSFLNDQWIHSELIQCLSRYATPQNQGLAVMGLKEYMSTRRNQEQIQELPNYRPITSAFTDDDRISSEIENRWQACQELCKQYDASNPSLDIETQLYQNIDDLITYLERKGRNDSQIFTDASAIKQQIEQSRQERADTSWQKYQAALANKRYDDATTALEAWHTITGESIAAEINKIRLAKQDIEKQSKPLSEQLTFSSAGAFAGSLKKARNGQEFSDKQFKEIKQAFADRKSEIAKWKDTKKKRGDIEKQIGKEKTDELFKLIQ